MPVFYLRSTDGSNVDNGSTWALAFATMSYAATQMSPGDTLYVSQNHAESTAADVDITFPGTPASPNIIICGNDAAQPPTSLATTATIDSTGSGNHIHLMGSFYVYGCSFRATQDGASTTTGRLYLNDVSGSSGKCTQVYEQCLLKHGSSNATSVSIIGDHTSSTANQHFKFIDTDITFGSVGSSFYIQQAQLDWVGGSLTTNQTNFIQGLSGDVINMDLVGVDLSVCTGTLFNLASTKSGTINLLGCKLGTGVTIHSGTKDGPGFPEINLIDCDSGDTHYRSEHVAWGGVKTIVPTIKRTTGAASDGETAISWKIVTDSDASFHTPYYSPWIQGWIDTTGSKTWKMQILHDSVTNLQDDEVWLEVDYAGTPGSTLFLRASDRMTNVFSTAEDQSTTGDTWTESMSNPNTQDLSVTKTVNEIGPWRARLVVAKAYTLYADPKIDIT